MPSQVQRVFESPGKIGLKLPISPFLEMGFQKFFDSKM